MTEKNLAPENSELAEEALEQVSGGEGWIQLDPNEPYLYGATFNLNEEKK